MREHDAFFLNDYRLQMIRCLLAIVLGFSLISAHGFGGEPNKNIRKTPKASSMVQEDTEEDIQQANYQTPAVSIRRRKIQNEVDIQEANICSESSCDEEYAPCNDGCLNNRCLDNWLGKRVWIQPEYAVWWLKGTSVPALVTTNSANVDRTRAGRLNDLTTTTLFGGENIGRDARSGGRIRLGFWFNPSELTGVELSYLELGSKSDEFSFSNLDYTILARPFDNVEPGFVGQDAELVAFPGLFSGNIQVIHSASFRTAEVLFRHALSRNRMESMDVLFGWRYNQLNDNLTIQDSKTSTGLGTGLALGTTFEEVDRFSARNRFDGFEMGLRQEKNCGCCILELTGKIAIGSTRVRTNINGETIITVPVSGSSPDVSITPSGLLVQQSNQGIREANYFSAIPEIGGSFRCQFTHRCRLTVGYTFLYWPAAVRSGSLIDPQLNLSQLAPDGLTGAARPAYTLSNTGLWAQGVNVGFAYQF